MRPAERWWPSFAGTIRAVLEMRKQIEDPRIRAIAEMGNDIIAEQTFNGAMADKDAALTAFAKRIADVTAAIPTEPIAGLRRS